MNAHGEIVILCTLEKQVDIMNDKFPGIEGMLKILLKDNNATKQELFLLTNLKAETSEKVNKQIENVNKDSTMKRDKKSEVNWKEAEQCKEKSSSKDLPKETSHQETPKKHNQGNQKHCL